MGLLWEVEKEGCIDSKCHNYGPILDWKHSNQSK